MLQILIEMGSGITTKLKINLNSRVHGLKAAHFGTGQKAKALAFVAAPSAPAHYDMEI
jgi:hypothetical protein